jgi:hypothetical protein
MYVYVFYVYPINGVGSRGAMVEVAGAHLSRTGAQKPVATNTTPDSRNKTKNI